MEAERTPNIYAFAHFEYRKHAPRITEADFGQAVSGKIIWPLAPEVVL
jgi:hypothetical protein